MLQRLVAHPTEALQIKLRQADNKAEDNLKKLKITKKIKGALNWVGSET